MGDCNSMAFGMWEEGRAWACYVLLKGAGLERQDWAVKGYVKSRDGASALGRRPEDTTRRSVPLPANTNTSYAVHNLQVVPMKKLLLWVEMARQDVPEGQKVPLARWEQVLRDLS